MNDLRILVIDDSLTIRKLVEIALRGTAHQLDYAASGQAGVARAHETSPDLVLCDFVLPDMRGSDVCRAIARDPRSQRAALVVMSGKQEQIRSQFADLTILDFLGKPFGAEAVVALVTRAARQRRPAFAATRETALALAGSFRAQLYEVLCDRLARIPGWSLELGAEAPATFFARKLFTEPVLAELFESLLPIYQQTRARIPDRHLLAEGKLTALRPAHLLELAVQTAGTTELTIHTERGTTVFFSTAGRLYTSAQAPHPAHEPAGLADAMRGREGRFTWRRLDLLPPAVCGEPVPMRQLQLECLRLHDDLPVPRGAHVLVRAPGFSDRVRDLHLDAEEQRVVTLIDGASPIAEVVARAGGVATAVQQAISRLVEIGLVRARGGEHGSEPAASLGPLVVVIEPDEAGFRAPLARHLAGWQPAAGVLTLEDPDHVEGVLRQHPSAVIVNATCFAPLAIALAEAVAADRALRATRVIAVLDAPDPIAHDLRAAGCDAVLVKPIHFIDLDWMLTAPRTPHPDPIVT